MKKTIIICSCIMFASISGLAVFLVLHNQQSQAQNNDMYMMNQSVLNMISEDTTFDDFKESFQEGLSDETLSEAERLFNEIKEAKSVDDTDKLRDLMIEISALDLFESSSQNWGPGNMKGQGGFSITDAVGGSDMPQGGGQGGGGMMPEGGGMPGNGG